MPLTQEQLKNRFVKKTDLLMKEAQRLDVQGASVATARMDAFRHDVNKAILRVFPSDQPFEAAFLGQLSQEVTGLTAELEQDLIRKLSDHTGKKLSLGERLITEPLRELPEFIAKDLVGVSPELVTVAKNFSADLISARQGGLAADVLAKVNTEIQLGTLGAKSSFSAIKSISDALGEGKDLTFRAERIFRTEGIRMQNMASQASLSNAAKVSPNIMKQWVWSGISRIDHATAPPNGQVVPTEGTFTVKGFPARFPGDPGLPVAQVANCGCFVMPFVKNIEMSPEGLSFLDRGFTSPVPGPAKFLATGPSRSDIIKQMLLQGTTREHIVKELDRVFPGATKANKNNLGVQLSGWRKNAAKKGFTFVEDKATGRLALVSKTPKPTPTPTPAAAPKPTPSVVPTDPSKIKPIDMPHSITSISNTEQRMIAAKKFKKLKEAELEARLASGLKPQTDLETGRLMDFLRGTNFVSRWQRGVLPPKGGAPIPVTPKLPLGVLPKPPGSLPSAGVPTTVVKAGKPFKPIVELPEVKTKADLIKRMLLQHKNGVTKDDIVGKLVEQFGMTKKAADNLVGVNLSTWKNKGLKLAGKKLKAVKVHGNRWLIKKADDVEVPATPVRKITPKQKPISAADEEELRALLGLSAEDSLMGQLTTAEQAAIRNSPKSHKTFGRMSNSKRVSSMTDDEIVDLLDFNGDTASIRFSVDKRAGWTKQDYKDRLSEVIFEILAKDPDQDLIRALSRGGFKNWNFTRRLREGNGRFFNTTHQNQASTRLEVGIWDKASSSGTRNSVGHTLWHETGHAWDYHTLHQGQEWWLIRAKGMRLAYQKQWDDWVDEVFEYARKNDVFYKTKAGGAIDGEVINIGKGTTTTVKGVHIDGKKVFSEANKKLMKTGEYKEGLHNMNFTAGSAKADFRTPFQQAATALQKQKVRDRIQVLIKQEAQGIAQSDDVLAMRNTLTRVLKDLEDPQMHSQIYHYRWTDRLEMYAEGFSDYMNNPLELQATHPEFYEWLRLNVFNGREFPGWRAAAGKTGGKAGSEGARLINNTKQQIDRMLEFGMITVQEADASIAIRKRAVKIAKKLAKKFDDKTVAFGETKWNYKF